MNITELARKLKMNTSELFDVLPQLGFDIGRRAIKINDSVANKIINNWSQYKKQLEIINAKEQAILAEDSLPVEKKDVKIPHVIIVRDFARLAGLNVSMVLGELMKNGIFVSMNEKIDFDTAAIIGEDLNLQVLLDDIDKQDDESDDKLKQALARQAKQDLASRPPVIVVMGHVDHGKTKLLDAIRQTDVVAGEAGGITQHIGAYQIERKKKMLTFIDTPGHEVFTAMRSRGAKVADVAILVVAADDGVKPQTIEAYRIIEQAHLPFVVAINKIDKADADIEKTKTELATKLKINPEEWGGKTICAPISAKDKIGIDDLLDSVLLIAEMEKDSIVANPDTFGLGTVIESHVDKGEGPVATILIQNGTLRTGDVICLNKNPLGKVRIMKDYKSMAIDSATPSTPVRIAGLKLSPNIGDIVEVYGEDKKIRLNKLKKDTHFGNGAFMSENDINNEKVKIVNVIVKSDVLGSAEAIEESLEKLNTDDIKVRVLKKGLGGITESDVDRALSSDAVVLGFNVSAPQAVRLLARDKKVEIKTYSIIYELVDDIKKKMESMLGSEVKRRDLGELQVLAVFKVVGANQVVGGKVISGFIESEAKIDIVRAGKIITGGEIINIQSGKENVRRVDLGQECGVNIKSGVAVQAGDSLKIYKEDVNLKKL